MWVKLEAAERLGVVRGARCVSWSKQGFYFYRVNIIQGLMIAIPLNKYNS